MIPAAVCPRVTLTIEISEVLFDAIQITAAMSRTTVPAFIGSALRETQIAFFAESSESLSDVVVLDVREVNPAAAPGPRKRGDLGALQRAILASLENAPNRLGVYDLKEVRKKLAHSHHGAAVSRAVHQLVRRGWMVPTGTGTRYVRRGAGS
jgi:hypothetical protein